jgi:O-antigen ligase
MGCLMLLPGRADVQGDEPVHILQAVDKSLGINADLGPYGASEREARLAAMEASGFRWLRHRFPWDEIEAEQGIYDWAAWDAIVTAACESDLRLIAVLDGSPAWARSKEDAENALAPAVEPRDFGAFARSFAQRYGDRVDHYQIWDEPNIAPHWGAKEIEPAAYGQLLREASIQIHAVDPDAVIILAALAPNVESGGANMSELLFLEALYQQGSAEWFDVVAAQPYRFDEAQDAAPAMGRLNWQRVALLREVMRANADGGSAVWATSFGLADQEQGEVARAVVQVRGDWPWMGPMLWAAWAAEDGHGEYALVGADGLPQTAASELVELAQRPAVAWPGVYPADHASGRYEGEWRVTPLGADIGESGDRLAITFQGTGLDLMVRRGDYRAFLHVSVDGEPASELPQDEQGRSYVSLYDPLRMDASVPLVRELASGEHVVEIVAERGWGQWAIAGWAVRGYASRAPWWPAIVLGGVALASLGLAAYTIWPSLGLLCNAGSELVARYRALDERLVLGITAGTAILLYAVVGTVPSLLVLAVLALMLVLRPEAGLPLIALALPFYQPGKPLLGKVFSMVEILVLLTAAGWLAGRGARWLHSRTMVARGEGPAGAGDQTGGAARAWHLSTLDWGVVALVVIAVASLLWSENLREAARELRTVVFEAALYYGLLRALVHDRRTAWGVVDAWVLGGALIAMVGAYQWAFGHDLITADGVWRVRGFYGSPNNLALYLGRLFPLATAVAAFGAVSPSEAHERGSAGRRWAYGLAALLMGGAILLTYSRGAWLLGVPTALLFLAAARGRRTLLILVVVLLLAAVLLLVVGGPGRLTSLLDTTEGTTFYRLQLWRSSWAMIRDHPVLGVGLDNFLYKYRTHYVLPSAWEEYNLSHPHNVVMDFWLRLGLPGLVILVVVLAAFFRRAWRAYRLCDRDAILALGLMAAMVNLVAHGLVDNAFFLVDLGFGFMIMLALLQIQSLVCLDGNRRLAIGE